MYKDKFISGIITAAGMGMRMKAGIPKLELKIFDKAIVDYAVEKFYKLEIFDEIILVASKDLVAEYEKRFSKFENLKVILGGNSREESTYLGLKALNEFSEIVVCHDGARPFVSDEVIIKSINSAIEKGSGVAGVKVKDTIKIVENNFVLSTPPRNNLYQIQTPQSFQRELIVSAYDKYFGKIPTTDDAGYLEAIGEKVYIVQGDYKNIKITTPEDMIIAKAIMEAQ